MAEVKWFKVPARYWPGSRSYVQGLLQHKPSGTLIVHLHGPVFHTHKADGTYLSTATVPGIDSHGSTVGMESTGADTMRLWFRNEKLGCTGYTTLKVGQSGALPFTKVGILPEGDVSIDQDADLLCIRSGNHFRGYKLSAVNAGKATKTFDFTIPGWGNRFQGHLVADGKLYVHRDLATKSTSKAHVFDYKGKQLAVFDTTKMGDEAEGFAPGVYAVKRTGSTGPGRIVEATLLPAVKAPDPKPPTPPDPPKPPAPKRLHGVDVSSYQPGWKPATGDSFVFVKATEGTSYTNPERAAQLAAGRDKGLVVGHYHWLVPGKPLEQAAYFVKNADIRPGDILWCDWEKQGDGKQASIQDVAAFIAEVQRLVPTSKVGLYCNRNDWTGTSVKAGDGLWIAQYGVDAPNTSTDWVFWQYDEKPIDQNVSKFTNEVDLLKWTKVNRTPPVVKPPVTPDAKPLPPTTTPEPRPFPVIPANLPAERVKFRGGLTCRCVATSLPWVEYAMLEAGVIKYNIDIFQLGYRTDVDASAGTHAKGGNTDVGQFSDAALRIWREMGWTIQHRTRAQGFGSDHGHGWPKGCPHLSPGGRLQRDSWEKGRDGLRQNLRITGPKPTGAATPKWDTALDTYLKKIGAPPVQTGTGK